MKKIILCISALFTMTSVVVAADSAGNRADSIIMLGSSGGIHPATIIAPPLRLGILLGSDWMLGIDAGSSSYSSSSGGSKGTGFNSDVFSNKTSATSFIPGHIIPPSKTPSLLIKSKVVAVPMSTTMEDDSRRL